MFSPITRATSGSHKLWMIDYNKKPCQVKKILNTLKIKKSDSCRIQTYHNALLTVNMRVCLTNSVEDLQHLRQEVCIL